jgi:hypothetical protein
VTVSTSDAIAPASFARFEPLSILVTSDPLECTISVEFPSGAWEMVYQDGRFARAYAQSTRDEGTFEIVRAGGWPAGGYTARVKEGGSTPIPVLPSVLDLDPYYPLNSILLHGNGTNGSTSVVDQMGSRWTASGNAKVTTTTAKYGTGALLLDGSGDYASTPISSALGTGDLTVEAWIRIDSLANDGEIVCVSDPSLDVGTFDLVFEYKTTGALRGSLQNGSGSSNVDISSSAGLLATGVYYHVAFTVEGTTARLRINGVVVATGTTTGTRVNGRTQARVGYLSSDFGGTVTRYFNGRVDDVRVTQVCRYAGSGAITPPAAQLPSIPVPVQSALLAMPSTNDAQGVTTDGTHVWFSSSTTIYKYTTAGVLVTSRNVSGDTPTDKAQINGLFHQSGKLYVSAAKYVATGTSYIVEYDPDTLAYQTHRTLAGDRFSEGVSFAHGYWWVVFHANLEVRQYDSTWTFVAAHPLSGVTGMSPGYGTGTGYDGVAWMGNYLLCNIHEIYDQERLDVYAWDGTGFAVVCRQRRVNDYATQGICVDPTDPSIMWFALRNPAGDGLVKAVLT